MNTDTSTSDATRDSSRAASVTEMAEIEFEPEQIDREALPSAERISNPFMVSARIAALTLTKTKAELVQIVRDLGGDRNDGGEFWTMLQNMQNAQRLFGALAEILTTADTRLLCAASVVAVERGAADQG